MNFTLEDTTAIGEEIGIDWHEVEFTPESFQAGLEVELEHGTKFGEEVNVTNDDPNMTGQIAWIHLIEDPDYYEVLEEMEAEFDGVKTAAYDPVADEQERSRELLYGDVATELYNQLDKHEGRLKQAIWSYRGISKEDLEPREFEVIEALNDVRKKMNDLKRAFLKAEDVYIAIDEVEQSREAGTKNSRRYAYVLDDIIEKNPDYISPEVEKMAMDFIKRAERSAKSLADDEEEFVEYLEDAILAGPQLGNVASGDLLELLIGNQVMGAIPLADLKAEKLIRGDKIDVYDYLQAALQHLVERVALMWLRNQKIDWAKEYKEKQKALQRDVEETVVLKKPQQQVGGSVRRFATVRIDGQEY